MKHTARIKNLEKKLVKTDGILPPCVIWDERKPLTEEQQYRLNNSRLESITVKWEQRNSKRTT
jgi:hypothetical protein